MIEKENYFENDELAYEVWKSKYQLNNETLDEFFQRIAREFARLDNFKNAENIGISKLSSYGQERLKQNRYDAFYKLFKDFNNTINKVCDSTPQILPEISEFINTAEWKIVNEKAKKILGNLKS